MVPRFVRAAAIISGLVCLLASPAEAGDFIVTPFVATTFAPDTNIVPLADGAGSKKLTIGAAGGFLSNGIFGLEGTTSYSFGFFTPADPAGTTIQHSAVGTLMGDALFAIPRSITHESLRPYVAVGTGLLHAVVEYNNSALLEPVDRNLLGLEVGGGAIGFINRRAGFRFDLRRVSSLTHEPALTPVFGGSRLSYWRLGVGVIIRY